MANLIDNATIDGVSDITLFGKTEIWNSGRIETASFFPSSPGDTFQSTITLSGSNWTIDNLRIGSDQSYDITIDDSGVGTGNRIRLLELYQVSGVADVTLTTTRVLFVRGGDSTVNLTLGSENMNSIDLFDGGHTVTTGSGNVNSIFLGNGFNTVTTGSGWVGSLQGGDGGNQFTIGAGDVGSIRVGNGNDTVDVNGSINTISLGNGNDQVTLNGNYIGAIVGYSGVKTISNMGGNIDVITTGDDNDYLEVRAGGYIAAAVLGHGNNTLDMFGSGSQVNSAIGYSGDDIFNLRTARIESINAGDGNNTVTMTTGQANSILAYSGNDTVDVADGSAGLIDLNNGNDVIMVASGWVGSARLGNGDDTVTVGNGGQVDQVHLGSGANTLTISGNGQVNQVISNGDNTITLLDTARILSLKMDEGTNTLTTGNSFLESVYSHDGSNTVYIGAGANAGLGQMIFSGVGTHDITTDAWFGAIQIFDSSVALVNINAGGDYLRTGDGDDTVNVNGGWTQLINTRGGNDTVTVDGGNAGTVRLGDGDDLIFVTPTAPTEGVRINGGNGNDIANFSAFATGLTITLDGLGEWQNIAAPKGDPDTPALGWVSFSRVENLTGGTKGDKLTGNDGDNVLRGNNGYDKLFGLAGNDILDGGKGKDTLFGGDGADVFRMRSGDGNDRVKDFEIGIDQFKIIGTSQLSDLTFAQQGSNVLVSYDNISVLVENVLVADLMTDAHFGY